MMPDPKDYYSTGGIFLRQLYALAVMRALNVMERHSVLSALKG